MENDEYIPDANFEKTWYAGSEKQALNVIKEIRDDIKSVGTGRNYEQSLKGVASMMIERGLSLNKLTPQLAVEYLADRAVQVGQSQLNLDRQAMQALLQKFNHQLAPEAKLPVLKSEKESVLASRAYSSEQVSLVSGRQTDRNALATQIAHAAGLRAHELLTIQRIEERAPDVRESHEAKFSGRSGESYTVTGKGGLAREIRIPSELSARLEERRLDQSERVTDRGVHYDRQYDIGGGNAWSASFSRASDAEMGWSNGAHGLRHSYAQERMAELQKEHPRGEALRIVSQEMGHFRPSITEVYLR